MSSTTGPLTRLLLGLAVGIVACAGRASSPASAAPAQPPAALLPTRVLARAQTPAPVGATNAARVKKRWEAAAGGFGRAVAVSQQRRQVAYSNGEEVLLYDLRQGQRQRAVSEACKQVVRGGLAYAGHRLLIVCEGAAQVVSGPGAPARELPIAASPVTAVSFSGEWIAIGHHDGVVRVYSATGGDPVEVPVPGPPIDVKSLALSPDGRRVAVAWVQGSIWWWDLAAPSDPHPLVRHPSESDAIAFSASGDFLAEEGATKTTTVWSFAGAPREAHKIQNGAWVKSLHFTRDGKWLVRGGSDGLELAEIAGPQRVALDTRGAVEDVALDEDGATIAAVDRDGRLTVWAAR